MRVVLCLRRTTDDAAWEVTATVNGDAQPLRPARRVPRLSEGAGQLGGFPLPPKKEVAAIPEEEPHRDLCAATTVKPLHDMFSGLAARTPTPGAIRAFGRYLHAVLLGQEVWAEIERRAGDERIDLALNWSADESELNRLPWEMMRAPEGYLVDETRPEVTITRLAAGRPGCDRAATPVIAPRVLFAVGADLTDASIRWGAEYLGLLRHLQRQQLGLLSKLVLRASPDDVAEAIDRFKPSVVHFICHGRASGLESAKLVLRADDDPERVKEQELDATQLARLITRRDDPPQVVVLNACLTGVALERGQPPSEVSSPMSVELVRSGVPVVVGMWGHVADRVCRLFTRRFYEALLDQKPIVLAAARGRREGFERGLDAEENADWAFPAIFLSDGVDPELTTDAAERDQAIRIDRIARKFRVHKKPAVFCDRFEVLDAARRVIDPLETADAPVLVVQETVPSTQTNKFGKTRLLEEVAVQAVRENVAPCLVVPTREHGPANTAPDLAQNVLRAIWDTRSLMEVGQLSEYSLAQVLKSAPDQWPADLRQLAQMFPPAPDDSGGVSRRALVEAIRQDLERLEADCGMPVLILIDEVHRFGPGALELIVDHLLRADALRIGDRQVPLVLAYSRLLEQLEYGEAFRRVTDALAERTGVPAVDLGPFKTPLEDPLPYEQYLLLGDRQRYVVSRSKQAARDMRLFYRLLWDDTQGAPSKLTSPDVEGLVKAFAEDTNLLVEAMDEDVAAMQEATGP